MADEGKGWLASRFARLPTGLKMLLIFSAALFPLGLVAIFASIESAQQKRADRAEETLARLELKAQRLNSAFSRSVLTINTASVAIALTSENSGVCQTTLRQLEQGPVPVRYALYGASGRLRCASAGFTPSTGPARASRSGTIARLHEDGSALSLYVFGAGGTLEGVAEYGRPALSDLTYIPGTRPDFNLDLSDGAPPHGAPLRLQGRRLAPDRRGGPAGRRQPAPAAASCSRPFRSPCPTCCSSCCRC